MKSVLYAVVDEATITWQVTLDVRADVAYWFGQQKNPERIIMLDPALSFGQAVQLKEKLNRLDWRNRYRKEEEGQSRSAFYQDVLKRIHMEAADLVKQWKEQGQGPPPQFRLMECTRDQAAPYVRTYGGSLSLAQEEMLERLAELMQGRSLLLDEVHQLLAEYQLNDVMAEPLIYLQAGYLRGLWELHQGVRQRNRTRFPLMNKETGYECRRCGSGSSHMAMTKCMYCGTVCPYCEQCLTMGRSRYCAVMIVAPRERARSGHGIHPNRQVTEGDEELNQFIQPWGLSEIQAEASGQALTFMKGIELHNHTKIRNSPNRFLIWAVTGAGKTEMIFPMIHYMIAQGGKVVIATPRRDVVLELKPRIEKAFSALSASVVTLYGGSDERWGNGDITIATTHQLMRFEQAFDLVIIDELDAFPYHNNPVLQYAAEKVCKTGGMTLLLSATPPRHLQREASSGRLPHVKVTARYHRHPLPVPVLVLNPPLKKQIQTAALDPRLVRIIQASMDRGAQLFVFVPKIYMVEPLTKILSTTFPQVTTRGTSSKDDERSEKVIDFRGKDTRILVTTTILERGVTIPKSDVLILDADEPIFDAAALVQMSGRAGRSAEDPAGRVYFAAKEKTRAQGEAIKQIKEMNRLARKKGYLIEKGANRGSTI